MRIFMILYDFLWRLAIPFLRKHKRLREGFSERLVQKQWPYSSHFIHNVPQATPPADFTKGASSSVIWVQAASGGEAWLVHGLAKELDALVAEKKVTLVCTTCTLQGLQVLQKLPAILPQGLRIQTAYFPLDAPKIMHRALTQMRPKLLVLLETELWPGLLYACHEQKVPVVIVNGRMTEKSMQGYKWLRWFFRQVAPQHILAISKEDALRFASVFSIDEPAKSIEAGRKELKNARLDPAPLQDAPVQRIEIMPNIKFGLVYATAIQEKVFVEPEIFEELPPFFALASTREQEEAELFELILRLLQQRVHGMPVKIAVAPRHLHRLAAWQDFFAQHTIEYIKRSDYPQLTSCATQTAPVLLWDTFGELDALYTLADVVFVGGSLAPLGGQNFLEPLGCGAKVVVGPSLSNFSWVGDAIFTTGLVTMVADVNTLEQVARQKLEQSLCTSPCASKGTRKEHRLADKKQKKADFLRWLHPHLGGEVLAAKSTVAYLGKDLG